LCDYRLGLLKGVDGVFENQAAFVAVEVAQVHDRDPLIGGVA
jgi:hypothetical protein